MFADAHPTDSTLLPSPAQTKMLSDPGSDEGLELVGGSYPSILIVDDNPTNLVLLSTILQQRSYQVRKATSGLMALQSIQVEHPDLIVLDICMPKMSGYELCEELKLNLETRHIPIIFISALADVDSRVKGLEMGGVDYITKPFHGEEVLARVDNHLTRCYQARYFNNLTLQLHAQLQQQLEAAQWVNHRLSQEILEHRKTYENYQHLATHDPLTGTFNRVGFLQALNQCLATLHQDPSQSFTVVVMEYDRVQLAADPLGYALQEDALLLKITTQLSLQLTQKSQATLAYLGTSQFAILWPNVGDADSQAAQSQSLIRFMKMPLHIQGEELFLKWSSGVVIVQEHYQRPEEILRDAELTLHENRHGHEICCVTFDPDLRQRVTTEVQLTRELKKSLQSEPEKFGFKVAYQPIVCIHSQQIVALEALVRWHHPELGTISPAQFIPLAEKSGLVVQLDRWVFQKVCQQLQALQQAHDSGPHATTGRYSKNLVVNINFSSQQFSQPNLIQFIDQTLDRYQVCPQNLKIEITESNLMEQSPFCKNILHSLKQRKIQLALDDFGTGYSTFSYIQQIPFDTLKIDQSFIQEITRSPEIIKTIINLSRCFGMSVVAEGIETREQLQSLRSLNCDMGQGFLFSRPMDLEQTQVFLSAAA